jgi:spermidine synthase
MGPAVGARDWHGASVLYFSVALISISVLMLEIGLIRVFSVMFDFHYGFLAISLAILGLGVGGIYVHTRVRKISNSSLEPIQRLLPISSGLMALSTFGMTILIVKVTIIHHIFLAASLAFAPFFYGGIFLAAAFRLFPDRSSRVYAADLIGASIGSLLILFVFKLGGINVILLVAVLASLPAGLLIFRGSLTIVKKMALLFLILGLISVFLLNYLSAFLGGIPFSRGADKEMRHLLAHPETKASIIDSRWSAFGRTDLVADEKDTDEMVFFVDGTAGTAMYRFDGDLSRLDNAEFTNFPGYFPLKLISKKEKEKVLIIGSGGGREVLISLLGGAKEITAVEVNRELVDLMKKYSNFNGGIYNGYPGVKVVVEEGRNFIRNTKEKYDIIMLSLPVTNTSRSPEGFALTENFLFTVESINDYLDRLKSNGRLVVVAHEDMEILRLITTSLSALNKRGISPTLAMKHLYSIGTKRLPVFVLKKSPLTPQEAQSIHVNMHEYDYSNFSSFIPFVEQETHSIPLAEGIYYEHSMLNQVLYLMFQGEVSPDELIEIANFDLRAVTDNDPFFYKFGVGMPLIITFLLVLSSLAFIGGWLIKPGYTKEHETRRSNFLFLLLFSILGIGFMLIEIPLFQKFILFLGQPVYSLAVLLFSILIGAGIGSWISGIVWERRTFLKLRLAAMMVGLIVVTYILFLKQVFGFFLGVPFLTRILISFLLLMPLGFFLGMPFPLGMKLLDEFGLQQYVSRMWGVNGIGSVLGSTLAIALAISFGFSYSMIIGALLYFFVFILFSIGWISGKLKVNESNMSLETMSQGLGNGPARAGLGHF